MTDFNTPSDTRDLGPATVNEVEVWESNIQGRTFVETTDHRGDPRMVSTLGVGQRLRIKTDDRLRAQERIRDVTYDPFVNGSLRRIDQGPHLATASPNALSEDDLLLIFGLDMDDFVVEVDKLSEISHRRLKELAPVNASMQQGAHLDELIHDRYAVGGDTPTYREMNAEPSQGR